MQPLSLHASRLPLATLCPASTIPARHPIATTSPEATLGTAFHHLIGHSVAGQHLEAADVAQHYGVDAEELEILGRCAWKVWEQLRDRFPAPLVEEPLEWSGAMGRTLKGLVDLVSLIYTSAENLWACDMPSEARILDWKSGHSDEDHRAQMQAYAYLVCRRWPSVRRVYAVVARVRDQSWDAQYFARDDLERWWMAFTRRLEREPLPANPGRHCGYCPRALECPQKQQLLAQIAESLMPGDDAETSAFDQMASALATSPSRGRIYATCLEQLKLLEGFLEHAKAVIKADVAAADGSLSAGEGYELRLVEQQRRTILATQGWDTLRAFMSEPKLLECITVHKGKIEAAARADVPEDAPRGARREAVEELHRALEEAGAWSLQRLERLELKRVVNQLEVTP